MKTKFKLLHVRRWVRIWVRLTTLR